MKLNMSFLEDLKYRWTDKKSKIVLIMAVLLSIGIVAFESYWVSKDPMEIVYYSKESLPKGTVLKMEMLESVRIDKKMAKQYHFAESVENAVLNKSLSAGQLILIDDMVSKDAFINKEENQRLVTLKLDVVNADGWQFQKGDIVEVTHFDKDEMMAFKIMKNIVVYNFIFNDSQKKYPQYVVLLVKQEQRDYILSHRHCGHFEISL